MKRYRSILLYTFSLLLTASLTTSLTACAPRRQTSSESAAAAGSAAVGSAAAESAAAESTAAESAAAESAAAESAAAESAAAEKPDYTAVLDLIHSHMGPLYLHDIIEYLNNHNLKWAAYYNVSQERVDMTWEDKTTLLFLSPPDEDGNLSEPVLTVLDSAFYNKSFQENYLKQPDANPKAGYYPQTASRLLSAQELGDMNQTDLSIARNEIYARHGRNFTEPFLQGIFAAKSWYTPLYDESQFQYRFLNSWEKRNLDAIIETETARGYRFRTGGDVTRLRGLVNGSWISIDGPDTEKIQMYYGFDIYYGGPNEQSGYELDINLRTPISGSYEGSLINFDPILYTASLDGVSTQLFFCGDSLANIPMTDVFTYNGGMLNYAGRMLGGSKAGGVIEITGDGIYTYSQSADANQSSQTVKYIFKEGAVTEASSADSQPISNSSEAALAGVEMPEPYRQFLSGSLAVSNPFNEGFPLSSRSDESYFNRESYAFPRNSLAKSFALADVNGDGRSELFYEITAGPQRVLFLLGLNGQQLHIYDMFDSRNHDTQFRVYDNGNVECAQSYNGEQEVFYHYDKTGRPKELIRFSSSEKWLKNADMSSGHYYEAYYLNGDLSKKFDLYSVGHYLQIYLNYAGQDVQWQNLEAYQ